MIPANEYDFVNVQSGLIRGTGTGFADRSLWCTYEDAAYMLEIYRTLKAWDSHRFNGALGDGFATTDPKSSVPMFPPAAIQRDYLGELATICGTQRKYWNSAAPVLFSRTQVDMDVHGPGAYVTDAQILGAMTDIPTTSVSVVDTMTPAYRTKAQYAAAAGHVSGYDARPRRSGILNTYGSHTSGDIGTSLDNCFEYDWDHAWSWQRNGQDISMSQIPHGFLGDPNMFYRDVNDNADDSYSLEAGYRYRFAATPWEDGRSSSETEFVPVFKIVISPQWRCVHQTSGDELLRPDQKYWSACWTPGAQNVFYIQSAPAAGGYQRIRIHGYDDWTIRQLGQWVLSQSGATTWGSTAPWGLINPQEWQCEVVGYQAYVAITAMVYQRPLRRLLRA